MLEKFYPYEYLEDVFSIDYVKLYDIGYRAILFDIDNTLVPHGADSTEQVVALFQKIHSLGFKTLLLSNNSEKRILRFKKDIDTEYICEAGKPSPEAYLKASSLLHVKKEQMFVVGDQLFTDIYGANKAGIASVLVKYIGYYKREWKGYTRYIENVVLFFYSHSKKYQHRISNNNKQTI